MKRKEWEAYTSPESIFWHMDIWDQEEDLDLWFCSKCDEYWAIKELPANIVFPVEGSEKAINHWLEQELEARKEEDQIDEVPQEPVWDGKRKLED
jgi:hypothetical protein